MNLYVGQSGDKKLIEAALAAIASFPPAEFFQFESSPIRPYPMKPTEEEPETYCNHEVDGRRCLMKPWHTDPDINLPHFVIYTDLKPKKKRRS